MSLKYFCDFCGDEITKENEVSSSDVRLGTTMKNHRTNKKLGIEVITSLDGLSNAGEFCKYCILDALYKLDDRPKEG